MSNSKATILVVDDSEIVLAMACEALQKAGFEVVTATTAIGVDRYLASPRRPDLIILDVMLPVLDGDRKAKMLKEDEDTKMIPVLLISSKPEEELRALVVKSRADGYIRKPFVNSQIIEIVEETLAQKRAS